MKIRLRIAFLDFPSTQWAVAHPDCLPGPMAIFDAIA
jgi:hypothetical protein